MAVRIRLMRMGAKKRPFYRIVVSHAATPRDGRFIEQVGYYDPMTDPATMRIDTEKAHMWLQRGAQPTETTAHLLQKAGVSWGRKSKAAPAGAALAAVEPALEAAPAAPKPRTRKKAEAAAG